MLHTTLLFTIHYIDLVEFFISHESVLDHIFLFLLLPVVSDMITLNIKHLIGFCCEVIYCVPNISVLAFAPPAEGQPKHR